MSDPTDITDKGLSAIKQELDLPGKDPWQKLCSAACIFLSELIAAELKERAASRGKGKGKG